VPFAVPAIISAQKSLVTFRAVRAANVADEVAESADDIIRSSEATEVDVAGTSNGIFCSGADLLDYKSLVRYAEISSTGFQTHFSSA